MSNKRKNTFLFFIGIILIGYALILLLVPVAFTKKMQDMTIIRPFENLLNLKIDYNLDPKESNIQIKPNFDVVVNLKDFDVNKPSIDMHVAGATKIKMVLAPSALFSKNYKLKSLTVNNAVFDHVTDYGTSEITNYFQKYSKLTEEGSKYSVKTCNVNFRNLKTTLYEAPEGISSENEFQKYTVTAADFANYISKASNGTVKVSN